MFISKKGLSDAWVYSRIKKKIDWKKREEELLRLLDIHRGRYGKYDCIVPGSGGKDSAYAAHILKFKYGMSPLTVTWSQFYTQIMATIILKIGLNLENLAIFLGVQIKK